MIFRPRRTRFLSSKRTFRLIVRIDAFLTEMCWDAIIFFSPGIFHSLYRSDLYYSCTLFPCNYACVLFVPLFLFLSLSFPLSALIGRVYSCFLHFSHFSSCFSHVQIHQWSLRYRCICRTNFLFPNKQRESHVRARLRKSVQFGKIELYAPLLIARRTSRLMKAGRIGIVEIELSVCKRDFI